MKQKRKIPSVAGLVSVFAIACFLFAVLGAFAQSTPLDKAQLETLIYSVKGADLYRAHCAACHGWDAKGGGPMSAALKVSAPDLTVLAKNNKGQFPAVRLRKVITGTEVSAHGSREMPIWGPIFHQIEQDQDFGNVRVENIVKFLQSIQQKPKP